MGTAPRARPMAGWRRGRRRDPGLQPRTAAACTTGLARSAACSTDPKRLLIPRTELFCSKACSRATPSWPRVGQPSRLSRVVCNGVAPAEFRRSCRKPDAADLISSASCAPERHRRADRRHLHAGTPPAARSRQPGRDGTDRAKLEAIPAGRGLAPFVRFLGAMPARQRFRAWRLMVGAVARRALPYVVAGGRGPPALRPSRRPRDSGRHLLAASQAV